MKYNHLTDEQVITLQSKLQSALTFYSQRPEPEAKNMADLLTLAVVAVNENQERRKMEMESEPVYLKLTGMGVNGFSYCNWKDCDEEDFLNAKPGEAMKLYSVVQPAPDYFSSLIYQARVSANKAALKFPQPNYVLLKVAEEAGEVVRAGVHYAENRLAWDEVEGEIIQLLAMLIRLVTEGDEVNGVTPPAVLALSGGVK